MVEHDGGRLLGAVYAEVHMGPGRVRAVVLTIRLDLVALGIEVGASDDLLTAVVDSVVRTSDAVADHGTAGVAATYQGRCALIGQRVKVRLRPVGETRGQASAVDSRGWLELTSATGMVERITVDMLRDLEQAP